MSPTHPLWSLRAVRPPARVWGGVPGGDLRPPPTRPARCTRPLPWGCGRGAGGGGEHWRRPRSLLELLLQKLHHFRAHAGEAAEVQVEVAGVALDDARPGAAGRLRRNGDEVVGHHGVPRGLHVKDGALNVRHRRDGPELGEGQDEARRHTILPP